MDKVKVYNDRKYDVGLILQNGSERVIHPGSFALLARDDVEYIASIAPALFMDEKQLRLENHEMAVQMGFAEEGAEKLDAEAIRKHLTQRVPQIKSWLDTIKEAYLIDAICDVAADMDLPASKLQLLKERAPHREFIRED